LRHPKQSASPTAEPHPLFNRAEQHLASGRQAAELASQGFGLGGCAIPLSLIALVIGFAGQGLLRRSDDATFLHFLLLAIPTVGVGYLAWASAAWSREERQRLMYGLASRSSIAFLFFRPFSFDLSTTTKAFNIPVGTSVSKKIAVSFEEILGAICLNAGVALKSIGRVPNQLGPAALTVSDQDWQDRATELMASSKVVFVILGGSPGSMWEIEQIHGDNVLLGKTLWLMPPADMINDVVSFAAAWQKAKEVCNYSLGLTVPNYDPSGAVFVLFRNAADSMVMETRPFSMDLIAALAEAEGISSKRSPVRRSTPFPNATLAFVVSVIVLIAFGLTFAAASFFN
jgi:hypothetical protein